MHGRVPMIPLDIKGEHAVKRSIHLPEQDGAQDPQEAEFYADSAAQDVPQDAEAFGQPMDEDGVVYDETYQEAWPDPQDGLQYAYTGSWLGEEPAPPAEKPLKRTIFKPRSRKPSFALAVIVNSIRMLILLVLILSLAGAGAVVGVAKAYMETAPTLDLAAIDDQAQTSFIYDANGNLITDYKGTENRIMVSIDTMPLNLQHAFVAVEDARFYTHNGIDVKRIAGAFIANFVTGSQQGGSTITQQLIKNTLLSSEQSYKRKIQEAYLDRRAHV